MKAEEEEEERRKKEEERRRKKRRKKRRKENEEKEEEEKEEDEGDNHPAFPCRRRHRRQVLWNRRDPKEAKLDRLEGPGERRSPYYAVGDY